MRELVLERLGLLLSDGSGNASTYLVGEPPEWVAAHPLRERSVKYLKRMEESAPSNVKNKKCLQKGFDYNTLDDEDLINLYEYLCLRHWKQR